MQRIFFIIFSILLSWEYSFAIGNSDIGFGGRVDNGSIINWDGTTIIGILTLVQSILLKVVLPIIVIWASLQIAYELFTAEWDESKMKKAQKSIGYTAIALISVGLSYGLVSIISTLSF